MREKLIEERKKRIKKWLKGLAILLSVCFLVFLWFFIQAWFKNLSIFYIKNIIVEPPEYEQLIKTYIPVPKNTSIFALKLDEIYSKLKQIYFIDDCYIEKRIPDTLVIQLKIRTPWVLAIDSRSAALMDRNGYFLPLQENFNGWNVEGMRVEEIGSKTSEIEKLEILKEIEQWYNYYGISNFFKIDTVSIEDIDKIELKSPEATLLIRGQDIDKQFEIAKKVLTGFKERNLQFEYIDLRFQQPYVKEKIVPKT